MQLARLRELLALARRENRFYSDRLHDVSSLEEYFEKTPFTYKRDLVEDQAKYPPYGTNLTFPLERYSRFSQTSATTGQPLRWLDTKESWDWMLGCWQRVFEAAGVTSRDRVFFAASFGPFMGFWLAFECAARMGCLCIPGGGMSSEARLNVILDNEVTVLCCTPTYAIRLGEGLGERSSSVRRIIAAGEPGGSIPGTRALIEKLWNGARVVDHHGMTEIGPVTYGCPRRTGVLHVIESEYIAEIIDGELVLTNLGRHGSPLFRYRTGDLVKRAKNAVCECGTTDMALEGGIVGRADDMVIIRGVNVYPSAVENILRSAGCLSEYRVEVSNHRGMLDLHILAEVEPEVVSRLQAALQAALALRIGVSAVPDGTLPRFEMKAKRWVRRA